MTNFENNPEKIKPLKDRCMHCDKNYRLTQENALIVEYTKKPECNYVNSKCTHCGGMTTIFVPPTSNTIDELKKQDVPCGQLDYPSDDVYEAWLQVMGIELIQPQELTPRQENRVRFGAFILGNVNTVEEFLNETT